MRDDEFRGGLVDGPRGRRVCLSLLMSAEPSLWTLAFYSAQSPADADLRTELARRIADFDLTYAFTDAALLDALAASTDAARYWQEPDEHDLLLQHPELIASLKPVARQVVELPSTRWWSSACQLNDQRYVQWLGDMSLEPLALSGTAARLDRWRAHTAHDEQRAAERPSAVTANWSGEWWSTPAMVGLVTTTRSLPGLAAVKLALVEDGLGWTTAAVWPVRPATEPRVYEITGPQAWTNLVARYPMDVSLSRRHDWWRSGGQEGGWLLPDWAAVASEFDAVHLTVMGYLTTAGRPLPVGGEHTMLAGWDADETYWLGDVLETAGEPERWERDTSRTGDGGWHAETSGT